MSQEANTAYDLIKIVNTGNKTITLAGNTRYEIAVGAERIIPFVEAASWFGDPRLQNVGRDTARDMAWRLTQNLWGYTEGMQYPVDPHDASAGFMTWDEFKPKFEAFDMNGEQVYFIIDDPLGTAVFKGPELIDPATQDNAVLTKQMAEMERTISELKQMMSERSATDGTPAGDDTTDTTAADTTAFDSINLPQPTGDDTVSDDAPRTSGQRDRNRNNRNR